MLLDPGWLGYDEGNVLLKGFERDSFDLKVSLLVLNVATKHVLK